MATLAPAQPIKVAILGLLNQLVTAGTLGTAISYDLSKNPLSDANLTNLYPVALLGTAKVEGRYVLNTSNERAYTFPVMVIARADGTRAEPVHSDSAADRHRDARGRHPQHVRLFAHARRRVPDARSGGHAHGGHLHPRPAVRPIFNRVDRARRHRPDVQLLGDRT